MVTSLLKRQTGLIKATTISLLVRHEFDVTIHLNNIIHMQLIEDKMY